MRKFATGANRAQQMFGADCRREALNQEINWGEVPAEVVSPLFAEVADIPLGGRMCVVGEPGTGTTATGLELARVLTRAQYNVLWVDVRRDLISARVTALDSAFFHWTWPRTAQEVLRDVQRMMKDKPELVVIIDGFSFLTENRNSQRSHLNLAAALRTLSPRPTVIMLDWQIGAVDNWHVRMELTALRTRYEDSKELGTEIKASGPLGSRELYVSRVLAGRFSMAYDAAITQKASGTRPSGFFRWKEHEFQGFWNFIRCVDSLEHEYETN